MRVFKYKGFTRKGKVIKGKIKAFSEEHAKMLLTKVRTYEYLIDRGEEKSLPIWLKPKVTKLELADTFDQIHVLLDSGLDSFSAFTHLSRYGTAQVQQIALRISEDRSKGLLLSEAFSNNQKYLGIDISIPLKSAEVSGKISDIFEKLSKQLESEVKMWKKVKRALIMPLFLLFLMIVAMVITSVFAIPKISEIFVELNVEYTESIKIMIAISNYVSNHGTLLAAQVIVLNILVVLILKYPLNMWWSYVKVKIPVIGPVLLYKDLIDLYRFFSFSMDAGLSIAESLKNSMDTVRNKAFKQELKEIYTVVISCEEQFHESLFGSDFVPESDRQSIAIGAETGKLPYQLSKLADSREKQLDELTKNISESLNPILTVIIGTALIALSVLVAQIVYSPLSAI